MLHKDTSIMINQSLSMIRTAIKHVGHPNIFKGKFDFESIIDMPIEVLKQI